MTHTKARNWFENLDILDKYKYMASIGLVNKPIAEVSVDEMLRMYGTTLYKYEITIDLRKVAAELKNRNTLSIVNDWKNGLMEGWSNELLETMDELYGIEGTVLHLIKSEQ